jgi:hypothetical protein
MIQVPVPRAGNNQVITWLVTAKHVLRTELPDHTPGPFLRQVKVRYNLKQASQETGAFFKEVPVDVTDQDGHLLWVVDQEDETVDVALTRFPVDQEKDDIRLITIDQILSFNMARELSLNENDEILFAGLFAAYTGTKKNYPIVRHGKIALVAEEKIPVRLSPTTTLIEDVYLAEITSFGGNSGSPVFLRIPPLRETTKVNLTATYSYLLLGVMQGFFSESEPMSIQIAQLHAVGTQNSGIALVVPADKILTILKSKHAEAQTLWAVANTYLSQGKLEDAVAAYQEASDDLEKSVGPDHPLVAILLHQFAVALERAGYIGKARLVEKRAQGILAKHTTHN